MTFENPMLFEQAARELAGLSYDAAAARHLAEKFFDSDRVLGEMLDQMGARP